MSQQTDVYFLINWLSACFGHYYVHCQENKTVFNTACGGAWFCWLWLCGAGTLAVCTVRSLLFDATQRCLFGELTPLSCVACMTICCSVHKSALTHKEITFSTFSNQ